MGGVEVETTAAIDDAVVATWGAILPSAAMMSPRYGLAIESRTRSGSQDVAPRYDGVRPRISVKACRKKQLIATTRRAMNVVNIVSRVSECPGALSAYRGDEVSLPARVLCGDSGNVCTTTVLPRLIDASFTYCGGVLAVTGYDGGR